jgi:uncharacterized coiled-coil protein SlyX
MNFQEKFNLNNLAKLYMDIAGNHINGITIPVESNDCDCWRNEGEMVEWGNKIKELNSLVKNQEEVIDELNSRLDRRNSQINEMQDIIKSLAIALSKVIIEEL